MRRAAYLEKLPIPAFLWDLRTQRFIAWNTHLPELLGYSDRELAQLDWRNLVVAEEIAIAERVIATGSEMVSIQWHWRRKDGTVIAVTLASRQSVFVDDDDLERDVFVGLVSQVGTNYGPTPASEAF